MVASVKLFRRDSDAAKSAVDTVEPDPAEVAAELRRGETAAKGRPTPKRREAQARKAGPVAPPPTNRREAMRRVREQNAEKRAEQRAGQARGDQRFLPLRDQGPARKLVRDIVDTRRNIASIFLFVALLVILGYFIPDPRIQSYTVLAWTILFFVIVFDSFRLGRTISRNVKERVPDHPERMRTLIWYGISRSTMIRKWRYPKAQLRIGDTY